jgi:hypothetical protein
MTKTSTYFVKGYKLNARGYGILDDIIAVSKRRNPDNVNAAVKHRCGLVFGLKGRALDNFIKRQIGTI